VRLLVWRAIVGMCLVGWGALAIGCGDDDAGPVDYGGPDEPGPYAVGVTELEIDDGQGAGRVLPITVWYPVDPDSVPAPDPEDDDRFVYGLGLSPSVNLVELDSPMHAVADARADARGPFPIVLFSHGNGGVRQQSFFMTEWLASHGFVVAAPDHVGNTILDEILDTGIPTIEAAILRPTDMSRTLDAVYQASDDPGSPIAGAADDVRVGIAGHSFGGFTSFRVAGATIDQALLIDECQAMDGGLLCGDLDEVTIPPSQADPRVLAALPQAPGGAIAMLPSGGFADVTVPTMIQAGDADLTTPLAEESEAPFAQLTVPASLLVLDGAGHFTFSDMCRFIEAIDPALLEAIGQEATSILDDGCGEDNLPWPRAHEVINAYTADFFHTVIAGTPGFGDLLSPDYAHPPEVADYQER
jgi:predicted dienelactone hydrolase